MWDHVTLRATDLDASATFSDTVLRTLGLERTHTADWLVEWDQFSLSPANAEKPPTRGLHIGFTAPTREHVHAFWQAGVDAGYRDDGEPGLRPEYGAGLLRRLPARPRRQQRRGRPSRPNFNGGWVGGCADRCRSHRPALGAHTAPQAGQWPRNPSTVLP